jgi:hypothetical protein
MFPVFQPKQHKVSHWHGADCRMRHTVYNNRVRLLSELRDTHSSLTLNWSHAASL